MTAPSIPFSVEAVARQLRLVPSADDAADLADIVAAVTARLVSWGVVDGPDSTAWPSHRVLGAVMLAARLFRRRNSPDGVANIGDLGAVYVQRTDPDVALLLSLGAYERPAVG